MKKNYQRLILLTLLVLLISYLLNATIIVKSIIEYTNLFITKLFPTSFIIYIISSILIDYGIINEISKLKLNGNVFYVTLMSLISGFPSGAKYTKELLDKDLITTNTANYLIMYTSFPNPIFILGSVSSILNKALALKILIAIIISNFFIAFLFRSKIEPSKVFANHSNSDFSLSLKNATYSAIKTLLIVYSSSLFFYLITVIINHYITLSPINYIILNGIFDLTKGIFSTPIIANINIRAIIILILLSIGSISIHIQTKSIIADTSIKYKNYLLARILQTIFALIIFFIL